MKNKKLTYLLVILVLLIWGYIFISIFRTDEKVNVKLKEIVVSDTIDQIITEKKLVLNFDFEDPFLRKRKRYRSKVSKAKIPIPRQVGSKNILEKKPIVWPSIKYGGSINLTKGLININDRQYILKAKDIVEKLTILAIFEDSITVNYLGESKTVLINKY